MSWFYIGEKKDNESRLTYKVMCEFNQLQAIGGHNQMDPLKAGPVTHIRVPQYAIDMETKNRNEARARVNFLNGGAGDFPGQITDSDNEVIDNG